MFGLPRWLIELEPLFSVDFDNFMQHTEPFLVVLCDFGFAPLLNLGKVLFKEQFT